MSTTPRIALLTFLAAILIISCRSTKKIQKNFHDYPLTRLVFNDGSYQCGYYDASSKILYDCTGAEILHKPANVRHKLADSLCCDADHDGIKDDVDRCPDVFGLIRYHGCPIPDRDKDGINDEEDKCPDAFGYARYQGCPIPDTDKDGVNDEEDKCIHDSGPASNFGCPLIPDVGYGGHPYNPRRDIFFASGTYRLSPKSFPVLNAAVQILKDHPTWKISVEGHTDSIGNYRSNIKIAEARAATVVSYIVAAGIDQSRVRTESFGSDRPIATNKTEACCAKNRRVELKLTNY